MVRWIQEDGGQTAIVLFQLDNDDLRAACTHRLHMVGSDGLPRPGTKPHPRAYGTFPRVAGRLRREGWFTLEDAVRRMTSLAAERFGLADRGVLAGHGRRHGFVRRSIDDQATFDTPTLLPTGVRCLGGRTSHRRKWPKHRPAPRTGFGPLKTPESLQCARPSPSRMRSPIRCG